MLNINTNISIDEKYKTLLKDEENNCDKNKNIPEDILMNSVNINSNLD